MRPMAPRIPWRSPRNSARAAAAARSASGKSVSGSSLPPLSGIASSCAIVRSRTLSAARKDVAAVVAGIRRHQIGALHVARAVRHAAFKIGLRHAAEEIFSVPGRRYGQRQQVLVSSNRLLCLRSGFAAGNDCGLGTATPPFRRIRLRPARRLRARPASSRSRRTKPQPEDFSEHCRSETNPSLRGDGGRGFAVGPKPLQKFDILIQPSLTMHRPLHEPNSVTKVT